VRLHDEKSSRLTPQSHHRAPMVATKREKLPVISPNSDSMLSSTEFFNGIISELTESNQSVAI
jgi:hypothetical protein